MKISIGKGGQVSVLLAFKETKEVNKAQELFNFIKEREIFKASSGEIFSDITPNGENVIFLGLGEESKVSFQSLRAAFYKLGKELMKLKVESAGISIAKIGDLCYRKTSMAMAEGLLQSEYAFEKYLSEKKVNPTVKEFFFDVLEDKVEKVSAGLEEITNLIEGVFLARDLVNDPAMSMTPIELARRAVEELEPVGVKVEVLGKEKIEELGMTAFLEVSKGSAIEPQFIIMNWNGNPDSDEKLALVGKGLTFDSGGYSIKPGDSMVNMYNDMAGSASVIGVMKSLALSKVRKNVVALVAACENMISGEAYKPGDIVKTMAGKTVEIWSTDAEGRLTLADALWYASTVIKANKIVDIATLTGACVVALGGINSGAITNNDALMSEVKDAADIAGEPVWQLPSNPEYKELIKGTVGDLKNSGGRGAGAITAGVFLEEFVNNTPWVHMDIAGSAFIESPRGYLSKGATGVPVKTLFYLAKDSNCCK